MLNWPRIRPCSIAEQRWTAVAVFVSYQLLRTSGKQINSPDLCDPKGKAEMLTQHFESYEDAINHLNANPPTTVTGSNGKDCM